MGQTDREPEQGETQWEMQKGQGLKRKEGREGQGREKQSQTGLWAALAGELGSQAEGGPLFSPRPPQAGCETSEGRGAHFAHASSAVKPFPTH